MAKNNLSKIIVILGPTASGKSDLGIKLAKKFSGEIISADSRQVYKGMNLGTGKVPKDSFLNFQFSISNFQSNPKSKISKKDYYSGGIKHYLIDVANPKKQFTADNFKELGRQAIADIESRNKIPIIVGGTGFYVDVLLGRMAIAEVPPNPRMRVKLEKQSTENLYKKLKKLDPRRAQTIDPKNKRRLIRALEIIKTTGKSVPALKESPKYDVLYIGINLPKEVLAKKIKLRLEKRLKQGMVKEIKNLLKSGVSHKRLYDFGLEYRWVSKYLQGTITKEMLKTELLTSIIKYSKRQMTWFKRNKEIHWLAPSKVEGVKNQKEAEILIRKFIFPLREQD